MDFWRRWFKKNRSVEEIDRPIDQEADKTDETTVSDRGFPDLSLSVMLLDDDFDWPVVPRLTDEQVAEEFQRLDKLLQEGPKPLERLMAQAEPRQPYLNLLLWVHEDFRGQISLTGPDIEQQRQQLERTFGLTTKPVEDSSLPPIIGNSLTIFQIKLGQTEPRLTVWFGPAMQDLARSYTEWLSIYGGQPYLTAGDRLIVVSESG